MPGSAQTAAQSRERQQAPLSLITRSTVIPAVAYQAVPR
jgi:hypothetical protein